MAADDSLPSRTGPSAGLIGQPALALLFAPGRRPSARDLSALVLPGQNGVDTEYPDRLEIVGSGLRYAVSGLAPGPAAGSPAVAHSYGFSDPPDLAACEAVMIVPAARVARRDGLVPVVRALVDLSRGLAVLPELVAVCWLPAGTAMAPGHFDRLAQAWLDGGAFPGLGLTALEASANEAVSTGLGLFTGFEVAVRGCGDAAANARLALRVIHLLVDHGASGYDAVVRFVDGEYRCAFSADRQTLLIERASGGAG